MRQPKQVHIYLYRKRNSTFEYAIFQRSDMTVCWQGVCGGLEDNETLEEGARRELWEEAGIKGDFPLIPLESLCHLPSELFNVPWGDEVVVVPMYSFGVPYDGEISLSDEHIEVRWLEYEQAMELVYFDSQKTSLYELHTKLSRGMI